MCDDSLVIYRKDFWVSVEVLADNFSRLFSFSLDEDVSIEKGLTMRYVASPFPLSV
jgi:hypothetical protein